MAESLKKLGMKYVTASYLINRRIRMRKVVPGVREQSNDLERQFNVPHSIHFYMCTQFSHILRGDCSLQSL
jgi:hypothetical protein